MAIGRAFTMRSKRVENNLPQGRKFPAQSPFMPTLHTSASVRRDGSATKKLIISSPVNLISTTNMLSYNAPNVATVRHVSASSDETRGSSDESDASRASNNSRETLTDASSLDNSPIGSPGHAEPNDYFKVPSPSSSVRRMSSVPDMLQNKSPVVEEPIPALPQRKPSHSKHAHQQLARQRSMQHLRDNSVSSTSTGLTRGLSMASRMSREQRESLDFFKGSMDPTHPFNNELQQLHEVAEELTTTVRDMEMCEDQKKMQEHGLARYHVDDYLVEIQPLYMSLFGHRMPEPVMWI